MYAKVFTSLFKGSLRGSGITWAVFVYLLANADSEGIVDIVPAVIRDDTGFSDEQVRDALAILMAADPDSRTPDNEGRRIVLLDPDHRDWGWFITNYEKYRAMRDADAMRAANRERKQRQRDKARVTRGHTTSRPMSRMSRQGEVEAEVEAVSVSDTSYPQPHVSEADGGGQSSAQNGNGEESPQEWATGFEAFWSEYPRKVAKEAAKTAYMRLKPRCQETYDGLFAGLTWYKRKVWPERAPDKVEHAATWLNQRRYTDAKET